MASWAACLGSLVKAVRRRYGAEIPFLAGTFTTSQDATLPNVQGIVPPYAYLDFLRFNFGNGRCALRSRD